LKAAGMMPKRYMKMTKISYEGEHQIPAYPRTFMRMLRGEKIKYQLQTMGDVRS
jgi:hypothetical protein